MDVDALDSLALAITARLETHVGILGSKNARLKQNKDESNGEYKKRVKKFLQQREGNVDEQTNAEIGWKHEKGSRSENIPRRSFLEVPILNHAAELAGPKNNLVKWIAKSVEEGKDAKECWRLAYQDLGHLAEQVVQRAFEQSGPGWPANSEMTKALKGSSRPLIDTGQLRKSIMSRVVNK